MEGSWFLIPFACAWLRPAGLSKVLREERAGASLSVFLLWTTFHADIVPGFKLALTIEYFNKFKVNLF